jgi:hypothetical protein
MSDFFSTSWAESVQEALAAGPSEQARAGKLQEYWEFFEQIKCEYPASWALGCRDLPGLSNTAYLFVQWADGTVTDCRIIGPDEPLKATYVLGMDYRDWKALHEGYDAQRTVMYRKIVLEEGDLLEFFKAIYFFVESLAVIGCVPGVYPLQVFQLVDHAPGAGTRGGRQGVRVRRGGSALGRGEGLPECGDVVEVELRDPVVRIATADGHRVAAEGVAA